LADGDLPQVIPVTLQHGLKILRGDLVLSEGRMSFVCHRLSEPFVGAQGKELEELVAKNPGSFSFEANEVRLIKRSFWTPGVLRVGKQRWVFRNGIEPAHRAPLKAWADRHRVANRGLG